MNFDNRAVLKSINKVEYFTFPILEETGLVTHAFSTRKGGVSKGHFGSMNLSLKLDDSREDVMTNIHLFCDAVGFDYNNIVMSNQTHSNRAISVNEQDLGTGIIREAFKDDVDGMITNIPGLVLMTFYADCVPIYFLDKIKKVIGLSHSGWRGTYDEIGKITVNKMQEMYGSDPNDIIAVTGPCICQNCYEVSRDLADKFYDKFGNLQGHISYINDRCYLNLSGIIKQSLISAGLRNENIVLTEICTCCNSDLLHSHRASGGKRGLLAAMMCLKEEL